MTRLQQHNRRAAVPAPALPLDTRCAPSFPWKRMGRVAQVFGGGEKTLRFEMIFNGLAEQGEKFIHAVRHFAPSTSSGLPGCPRSTVKRSDHGRGVT